MENENEITKKNVDINNIKTEELSKSANDGGFQIQDTHKSAENAKDKYLFIKKKKRSYKVTIILGAVLFFVIAIAGAYFLNLNKEPEKSPQEIIKSSIETMNSLKTYQIDGKINFSGSMTDDKSKNQSAKINIALRGKNDITETDNPKIHYDMKTVVNLKNDYGSEEYSADFEEMVFGQESIYFRVNDYDLGMEIGTMFGPKIDPYIGKWYFISSEETKKFLENSRSMVPVNMEAYDDSKIMDIISKYEILKFEKDLGDEKINGLDVYHYKAKLDGMAIVYMYFDIMKEVVSNYSEGAITSEEFEAELVKIKKEIEENYRDLIIEGFQKAEIEMWIGKEEGYIYRIVAKGGVDEKYLYRLIEVSLGSARAKGLDAAIKSDVATERMYLELHYDDNNGSYENFDLSEYSDLKTQNVRSNTNSYVIWAKLNSTTDKWCVDSMGKAGYVLGEIGGFECPESLSNVPLGEKKDYKNLNDPNNYQDWKINLNFDIDLSFNNFNKPMGIEKPEGGEDLFGVLEPLMSGLFTRPTPIVQDSDNDGLNDDMEVFYKTDKNNPDTDGDGYKDGEEVKNGYDPALPGDAKLEW